MSATAKLSPVPAASWTERLLIPREHGAWGMVSLPFIAAALVAGNSATFRTLAAALAVVSVFLLRTPLLMLWRKRGAGTRAEGRELQSPRLSLAIYSSVAAVAGVALLCSLPVVPLLLLGGGAVVLTASSVLLSAQNYQRDPVLQIASAIGLAASSLVAYLAARGRLEPIAFWIWALCTAHSATSVLVVHARLESIVASRKPSSAAARPHRRNALLAEAALWLFLGSLAVYGKPWLILPFLPPSLLHWWELWRMRSGPRRRVSMHRVGWIQLAASAGFCVLLIAVLR